MLKIFSYVFQMRMPPVHFVVDNDGEVNDKSILKML